VKQGRITDVEGVVESILRGSAKILGCTSASLIVIDDTKGEVELRVGTIAQSLKPLARVEEIVGDLKGASFALGDVDTSLVYRSWKEHSVFETSSLGELAGDAFHPEVVGPITTMIGDHRFICVPALAGDGCQGVVVFEKEGTAPFNRQQRELLVQYAQRIGDIIGRGPGGKNTEQAIDRDMTGTQLIQLAMGESAPSMMVDPDFVITSCNDAARRLFDYPDGSLVGRDVEDLFEDPRQIRVLLNHQFLFLSDGHFEEGSVLRRRDGSSFPGKVETLLLADREDRVVGFLVMVREQSALHAAAQGHLGMDRLMRQERLATMGEMAAQLAHEIRNPLVAIGATLEHVEADLAEGRDVREAVSDMRQEIARMDMTLKAYLSMAVRSNASIAPVDLAEVVEDAARLLEGPCKSTGKAIRTLVPRELEVLADADGMRHVFFNLLLNALEAMKAGGEVTCFADVETDRVTIRIEDTGTGLECDPEECFGTFFTTKKHGTGLGLTVSRKIVEAHGGSVLLETRNEGGVRACVSLPLKVSK